MNSTTDNASALLALAAGVLFLASTVALSAQVQTKVSTSTGTPTTHEVRVEQGEVLYVSGNDLIVRMQDGSERLFTDLPKNAQATVDGKPTGIHDLKPGMKLERTITVTKTPTVVTTTESVTGKVWQVMPSHWVILTLEDGSNQKFNIPEGQKFNIDGQMTDAWGLKKGMKVTATKVVEESVDVYTHEHAVTGTTPPPPPAPPADVPILIAEAKPVPPPVAATSAAPAELPKTASNLPLIGLLGSLLLLLSIGIKILRSTL